MRIFSIPAVIRLLLIAIVVKYIINAERLSKNHGASVNCRPASDFPA